MEEYGRWSVADTVAGIDLWPSIAGLLTSRLDWFDDKPKVAAQCVQRHEMLTS